MSELARDALRAEGPVGLQAAWLYGSHAEGRAHRESDVDIALLLDPERYADTRARFEVRVSVSSMLEHALGGARPDVVIAQDVPATLGRRIVQSGVLLVCDDPQAEHDFRRDVQLLAADLDPWLARMRRIMLDSMGPR